MAKPLNPAYVDQVVRKIGSTIDFVLWPGFLAVFDLCFVPAITVQLALWGYYGCWVRLAVLSQTRSILFSTRHVHLEYISSSSPWGNGIA